MANWQPAEYANGLKVRQEFVLTIGDHRSCTINLLNIRETDVFFIKNTSVSPTKAPYRPNILFNYCFKQKETSVLK